MAQTTVEAENTTEAVRDLFVWQSLSRTYKKLDKEVYSTIIAVTILLSVVFFFIKEFLLIVVAWAMVFFYYAVSQVAPEQVEHKISSQGLISYGKVYLWEDLGPFWFGGMGDERVLKISSRGNIFGQLTLLLGSADEKKLTETLILYLPYLENPERTFSDKAASWLSTKFSFEKAIKKES
ncbi:hypothetical protein A2872_03520 [Candidatus Gottesmanbacteria bacterium RIFCSPHIGHO2_01_FULL_42_12]|uniref:DUF5673 domain-containing protein n=1 Tax=Candidatus Gottesmanbacteria bacterium RIFCSPHIGHO2_01_FULL_42_12 TaxID=1798377 RepID=A0A1F5Z4W4_9BACT|nr:MAG: hypothetical protein A2872_03520 [Candidatus Gottesmanbacteria bacterium RIFCSPHIGHO2_01_FULL_42_12]